MQRVLGNCNRFDVSDIPTASIGRTFSLALRACRAERKKLKRRASKTNDDLHSDQESGEQMSDDLVAGTSTALVQYNQHSPDFAAMLRGFPEISEVPSPAQVLINPKLSGP